VACYQHVLTRLGSRDAVSDASLRRFIGPPLRTALAELMDTNDAARIEEAVTVYRQRFGTQGLYENAVYPGIPELLAGLQSAGHPLFIVTSKARVYADEIARHFGLMPYLSGVYGAELSGERSAKAELIGHLLHEQRIDCSAAVMIGDRRHDIDGAKAHGLPALGVLWGYGSRDELVSSGANAVVKSVEDLPAALRELEFGV
jgi:phosphoglycolate phosphatase